MNSRELGLLPADVIAVLRQLPNALVAFVLIVSVIFRAPALAGERKVALVVGNARYEKASYLKNAAHDAKLIRQTLADLGFEVIAGDDLDKARFDRALRDFATKASGADAALFYYAGHGVQVGGINYLIPVDAVFQSGSALDFEAVRLDLIQRTMEREGRLALLFIDACRDNPFLRALSRAVASRSLEVGKGLAAPEVGAGSFISFSTQPGNIALDGDGEYSPYAEALARNMRLAGEELSSVLINVRKHVMEATGDLQVPWEHSALRAKFYFVPPRPAGTLEAQVWEVIREMRDPDAFRAFLERFPQSDRAGEARQRLAALAGARAERPAGVINPQADRSRTVPGEAANDRSAAEAVGDRDVAAWSAAEASPSRKAYASYLRDFPAGAFAGIARKYLEDWKALASAGDVRAAFYDAIMTRAGTTVISNATNPKNIGINFLENYKAVKGRKAMAACIDWTSAVPYVFTGPLSYSGTAREAVARCSATRGRATCSCHAVDADGKSVLAPPKDWLDRFVEPAETKG